MWGVNGGVGVGDGVGWGVRGMGRNTYEVLTSGGGYPLQGGEVPTSGGEVPTSGNLVRNPLLNPNDQTLS